jgi:hypothetical protein
MNRLVDNWVDLMDPKSNAQDLWYSIKACLVNIRVMVEEAESREDKRPSNKVSIKIIYKRIILI